MEEIQEVYRGKIVAFSGVWDSGLGYLIIEVNPDTLLSRQISFPCENGQTVRALDSCFGGVITDNHCVDNSAIEGREILFSVDFMNLLEGFTPVEEASEELLELETEYI